MNNKTNTLNKFSRKTTAINDINRLQNIHQKIKNKVNIATTYQPFHELNNFQTPHSNLYKFKNHNSININFDISSRENIYDNIPKILLKEVPIPSYSETDNFDLNFSVSKPIHMDMFIGDVVNDGDINRIKKKHIYKIIHVYQTKYAYNLHPTGFGDFIRSCFFIIQFCTKYSFQYEIVINHPIAQFFKRFSLHDNISSTKLNNKVIMFSECNWSKSIFDNKNYIEQFLLIKQTFNSFIDYLCSLPVINGHVFSYNILYPYHEISIDEREKIRYLFEPSREISENVDQLLFSLGFIKNQYIVLHIRSGDSYLKNENKIFDSLYFEIIKNEIIEIMFNENKNINILLIADNNEIKLLLNDEFPSIKFLLYNITHIGEGVELETEKVRNTMTDFFLMSNSSSIYSFTSYPHGSGFSYWCAKMYEIPYKCKFINVN